MNQQIRYYASGDLVESAWQDIHHRTPNSTQINGVTSSVMQGIEYFEAAKDAPHLVRPVLLYYGTLALSRAVILLRSGQVEGQLNQSHGLSVDGWEGALAPGGPGVVGLSMRATRGTFRDLWESLGARVVWVYSAPFPNRSLLRIPNPTVPDSFKVSVCELLARNPAVSAAYERCMAEEAYTREALTFVLPQQVDISVAKPFLRGEVARRHSNAQSFFDEVRISGEIRDGANHHWHGDGPYFGCRLKGSWVETLKETHAVEMDDAGSLFLTAPCTVGFVPPVLRDFAVAFALGTLARYYPSRWRGIIAGRDDSRVLPLLHQALDYLEKSAQLHFFEILEYRENRVPHFPGEPR